MSIFFCLSVKRILRRRRPFFFAGGLAAMKVNLARPSSMIRTQGPTSI